MAGVDLLVVSPHFDDAVLSCAGRMHAAVTSGRRVHVATVMSGPSTAQAERQREDRRALASLGVEASTLGLLDAPFRHGFYRDFESIVLRTHSADGAFGAAVSQALVDLCGQLQPAEIVLPLGVGTHIDHRWVHGSWPRLAECASVLFYEDRPYAFVEGFLRLRLHQLDTRIVGDPPTDLAPLPWATLRRAMLHDLRNTHFVRTYLPPGRQRLRCALELTRQLRRVGMARPAVEPSLVLCPEVHRGDLRELDAVVDAVARYGTQLRDLFGDCDGIRRAYGRHASRLDPEAVHAERYWRLVLE